ncbi:hypothetical protein AX17_002162 [Amanita inopinata Kibby_2008]|nr:hypothetical protein AX17_002162 [Amanita inopinata Kibby_2008]
MVHATSDDGKNVYTCRCLNVRIYPTNTQIAPPKPNTDPEYTQVYVGDDGIVVAHPHITLRTRMRGIPIEGTSRCGRYTTLTCLICEVLVYRVYQIVPIDIEGKEGPLLPTEDWVENEIMKSSSGWIEVSNKCPMADTVKATKSCPEYSSLFSVVLPKHPPLSPLPAAIQDLVAVRSPSPPAPVSYLQEIKPLFPPTSFTPSHPVFLHLASIATQHSESLRTSAEEYIVQIVEDKIAEVERAEDELKEQVDALWLKFKATIDRVKKDRDKPKATPRQFASRTMADRDRGLSQTAPISVKEFVPVPVPSARTVSPNEGARVSALSASLAIPTFHHPSKVPEANGSIHSGSSHSSERTGSATLVRSPPREGGVNVLQFHRNIDDNVNTAISFKYFMDLEEEIGRKKRERLEEANRGHEGTRVEAGPSEGSKSHVVNDKAKEEMDVALVTKHVQVDTEGSMVDSKEKTPSKGKRKVTFDVEPEVVTINRESSVRAEQTNEPTQDSRDMVFELEDLEGEMAEQPSEPKVILPLLEQPALRPSRHRKAKSLTAAGLPSSLSSLRPLSLPSPSHIRPPRTPHGVDSSTQNVMFPLPGKSALDQQRRLTSKKHTLSEVPEEELDPRDAVVLRLVAADTPSHHGGWRSDSEAWKTFTRPGGVKGQDDTGVSEDEEGTADSSYLESSEMPTLDSTESSSDDTGESNAYHPGAVPASLPIPIAPLIRKKEPLSLASYQPKTSLTDRPGAIVPPLIHKYPSAATLRRVAYAERDRYRAMDPGVLDFATDDDEDGGGSSEGENENDESNMGTRSRKRALKILQVRSEIPEEGMWRSLAT